MRMIGFCLALAGCGWPAPVDVAVPAVVIEEVPAPIVREIVRDVPPVPKSNSDFFCAKPEIKEGTYHGMIDGIHVHFTVIQYGNRHPSRCYMYFDKFAIGDENCNGSASEFDTQFLNFVRNPPLLIDWKKVDRILKLGHRLACEKNSGENNKYMAEIESEKAFKLFRGIE